MNTTFTHPGEDRYFEDYVPASVHEFGPILAELDEANPLATCFASQDFHSNQKIAKNSLLGATLVSGWDSTGLLTRLLIDYYLPEIGNLSSPEVSALCWPLSIRAGDELIARATINETRRSVSEPNGGIVHSFVEVQNQDRKVVMSMNMQHTALCIPT